MSQIETFFWSHKPMALLQLMVATALPTINSTCMTTAEIIETSIKLRVATPTRFTMQTTIVSNGSMEDTVEEIMDINLLRSLQWCNPCGGTIEIQSLVDQLIHTCNNIVVVTAERRDRLLEMDRYEQNEWQMTTIYPSLQGNLMKRIYLSYKWRELCTWHILICSKI